MSEQACPGSCNYYWRQARTAFEVDLAAYDPLDPAQSRPQPPDMRAFPGDPWCDRCKAVIRRELAELDDLAAFLTAAADGHRGRRPGAKVTASRGRPSPSPAADLADELERALHGWETAYRGADPLARRGWLATGTTTVIAWLVAHFDSVATSPVAEDFGQEVRQWHRLLKRLTKAGTGVQLKPVRCPRCDRYSLTWTEGDDHVECFDQGCRRMIGMDEYDALAAKQDAEHAASAA